MISKRKKEIDKLVDQGKVYTIEEAVELLKKCPAPKFDQTVDLNLQLGIDPKKNDQQVRGTILLPEGTGKKLTIAVLAKGDKAEEAKKAGADFVGDADLIDKIKGGWTGFDALVATPDMMREVGKLGKILGPRGLMPSPKAGTVTMDVAKAVKELKAGKIEFKNDRYGIINTIIGKVSFANDKLVSNFKALIEAILRAKPVSAKGQYLKAAHLSTTMGPGLKIRIKAEG